MTPQEKVNLWGGTLNDYCFPWFDGKGEETQEMREKLSTSMWEEYKNEWIRLINIFTKLEKAKSL